MASVAGAFRNTATNPAVANLSKQRASCASISTPRAANDRLPGRGHLASPTPAATETHQSACITASHPLQEQWSVVSELQHTLGMRAEDARLICSLHPRLASVSKDFLVDNLDLLFNVLGISGTNTLLRRHPGLLLAPLSAWDSFFTACGMARPQFSQLLGSSPALFLEGSIYSTGRAMSVLRALGVADVDLCSHIPLRYPQLLLADVDTCLQPAADLLQTLGLPHATLSQLPTRCPRLLTCPPATTLAPTLRHLHTLPIPPAALRGLLASHPHILAKDPTDIDARLDFFHSIGIVSRPAAVSVLLSCPEALTYTLGNLERKWQYLRHEIGGDLEAVLQYPRYFAAGLQMEIGPRFLFVRQYPLLLQRFRGGGERGAAASRSLSGGSGTTAGTADLADAMSQSSGAGGAAAGSTSRGSGSDRQAVQQQLVGSDAAAGDRRQGGGIPRASPAGAGRNADGVQQGEGGGGVVALEWLLATPVAELVALVGESVTVYEDHLAACQHDLAVHWGAGSSGRAVT